MHADEVPVDRDLVARLVRRQLPQYAGLPLRAVASYGTDHAIFRLGPRLVVRLPRYAGAVGQAEKERRWLPVLAPLLPLAVPVPVAAGVADGGYPFDWSVWEWLPGESASTAAYDEEQAALDLAGFVVALRAADTTGAHERPVGARGAPLAELDAGVHHSVGLLGDRVDDAVLLAEWERSLAATAYAGEPVWLHGDLLPGNLLVGRERLTAVIDFGCLHVGDPACDLQPAWNVFGDAARLRFRDELGVDDDTWQRGRGWALSQAVIALPYYWETNPGIVAQARGALGRLLPDLRLAAPGRA